MTESTRRPVSELRARDVMTKKLLSVRPEWPVEQLADFLVKNSISGAPVVAEGDELVGVVSLTDVARASTLSDMDLDESARHEFYSWIFDDPDDELDVRPAPEHAQILVQEIMTPIVIEVDEEMPLSEVARTMVESRVHRLFVTSEGRARGIVTALDVMKVVAELG